ncbi:phosphate-starvation-inducible PsiE family protein [Flavobacterium sp. LB3P45]|uniref:Phosphate-starvation-inducible PsiE family protein n=1 Tax=Flavobacterium fructosi TaxID=3230416 RepID=A0ABW6HQ03_9FLAO
MKSDDKFLRIIIAINKNIIRVLIGIMTLILILGTLHLIYLEFKKIIAPPYLLIDVSTLFEVFNLILIIAIGYELIKALLLIISSDTIPTAPIIEISIIAISTKIITLDIQQTNSNIVISLALLIAALGVAYFLLKYCKTLQNKP